MKMPEAVSAVARRERDRRLKNLPRDIFQPGSQLMFDLAGRDMPTPQIVFPKWRIEFERPVRLHPDARRRHEFGIGRNRKAALPRKFGSGWNQASPTDRVHLSGTSPRVARLTEGVTVRSARLKRPDSRIGELLCQPTRFGARSGPVTPMP